MKTIGIVAEYNPFHKGHEYHIKKTRELAGDECRIVCVMSGDFVQRGEPAMFSKYARAEAACRCGADLVIELPLPWAISSAEGFARGAIGLLRDMGCTHISFGSECGDVDRLDKLARILIDPGTDTAISEVVRSNPELPYAAARQKALESISEDAQLLETPNNILALEYIKAIYELGTDIVPMTVERVGAAHDSVSTQTMKSASELRMMMREGRDVSEHIPASAMEVYEREIRRGSGPINTKLFDIAALSRMRIMPKEAYMELPDALGGLGSRVYVHSRHEETIEALTMICKTKRYALSRIRRLCMAAALGVKAGMADGTPQYARVLAFNTVGRAILHSARHCAIPVITRPVDGRSLPKPAADIYELTSCAHDLYALCLPNEREHIGGEDWRTGPSYIE